MDIQLNYAVLGEGFPLVLLHGNGDDLTYFRNQMEPFARHFQVIALETRGHGQSPRGTGPFTLDRFADALRDFLDSRGIGRCHLLGFSDGGNIALLFAMKYPQYLEKLVVDGANLTPASMTAGTLAPILAGWCGYAPLSLVSRRARRKWELLNLMATQPHITARGLSTIQAPTLVLAGEHDIAPERHTRYIAASIPGAVCRILPGDHCTARKNPEAFNRTVLDVLLDRPQSGPEREG